MGDCQWVPLTKLGALRIDLDFPRMIELGIFPFYIFLYPHGGTFQCGAGTNLHNMSDTHHAKKFPRERKLNVLNPR